MKLEEYMKGEYYRTVLIGCHAVLADKYNKKTHIFKSSHCPLCISFNKNDDLGSDCNLCTNTSFGTFHCADRKDIDIDNNYDDEFRAMFHRAMIKLLMDAPAIYFYIPIGENLAFMAQIRNLHSHCIEEFENKEEPNHE